MTDYRPDASQNHGGAFTLGEDYPPPDLLAAEDLPSPPRQERSRRAREALLAAALARFAEGGYEATTIDEIARQAGVAVGGFYSHFRSKRQVLLVLMDRLLAGLDAIPPVSALDDASAMLERIHARFSTTPDHSGIYRAWREATSGDASLAALHQQIEAWGQRRTAAGLRRLSSAPGARTDIDIDIVASLLNVLYWRSLESPAAGRDAVARTVVIGLAHIVFEDGVSHAEAFAGRWSRCDAPRTAAKPCGRRERQRLK